MANQLSLGNRIPCKVDDCSVDFARSSDMLRHVKECHGNSTYYCPVPDCSWRGAKRKARLESHLSKTHGDMQKGKSLGPFRRSANGSPTAPDEKRGREDDEEECDGPNQAPKQERPSPEDIFTQHCYRERRLACHFHLFKKEVYCKNNKTGKQYETCSGPGWSAMHHLKQHLGNSAGSVHKKIRCPRCLNSFKTASAVVKHLKANSSQCVQPSILSQEMQQSSFHQDDISEETWSKIDEQISRKEFNKLDLSKQTVIDHWVLANLDNQKPQQDEKRKWDLRKWNMTWRILFPNYDVPSSPFYDDDMFLSTTNTELLLKSFKETVDLKIELGDIEDINEETFDQLLGSLRLAISVASASNQEQRNLMRRRLLNSTSNPGTLPSSQIFDEKNTGGFAIQEATAGPEDPLPITDFYSASSIREDLPPVVISGPIPTDASMTMSMPQNASLSAPEHRARNTMSIQAGFGPSSPEIGYRNVPWETGRDPFNVESWDQFGLEWNATLGI